jgi:excinuclease ABC subunit C
MLSLQKEPSRIECYDISHTQGSVPVGSRVVFVDGKPVPELYRIFNIKTVDGINDYASLEEILERRFRRAWINGEGGPVDSSDPWALPDLVVIDGGPGQLGAAVNGMAKASIYPTAIGLATERSGVTRSAHVPICSLAKNKEQVFVYGRTDPINETPDSAALLLLRSLRDESHRFALRAHRKRRSIRKNL